MTMHADSKRNNGMIKVLMLTEYPYTDDDLLRGGVINAVYWLVQGLSNVKGLELTVLCPCKLVKKKEYRSFGNTRIIYYPPRHQGYDPLLCYRGTQSSLAEAIREINPDIVHAQGNADYIFAAVRCGKPHVVTVHGIFQNEFNVAKSKLSLREYVKKIYTKKAERYYIQHIQNLIAITKETETFVRHASENVQVFSINNALDDELFKLHDTSDTNKPGILFVAAITYRKGLHLLTEAFEHLLATVPNAQLRIAGMWNWDPQYVQSLMKKHEQAISRGSMHFLGGISKENLYQEFSRCSVFCLPSLSESAPMVIAQAMAAGKPVVASRVGGIPDMVSDGGTGYLIDREDAQGLLRALDGILTNAGVLKELGRKARLLAHERYASSSVAGQTMQAYEAIMRR